MPHHVCRSDVCALTHSSCAFVLMGDRISFLWPDQTQKEVSLPAPTYIDFVLSWLQRIMEDETVFPTKSGQSPPSLPLHLLASST